MANFPTSPAVGEQFSTSKVTYRWNGSAWDIVEGVKQGTVVESIAGGSDVKLLLHAEDTTDSSMSEHTVTFSGDTATSSTKKKFGSTSFYFDGTSDYIDCPDSDDFDFGTGDFTIELWFNTDQTTADPDGWWRRIFSLKQAGNSGTNFQVAYVTGGTNKLWSYFNDGESGEYGEVITDGNWHHLAVVRASGTLTIYVDGVSKDSRAYAHNLTGCQPRFGTIGHDATLANFEGYMDEIRITKGTAQYTGNFSVATEAFTNPALAPVGNLQFTEGSEPDATAGASTIYATSSGMFVKNSSGSVTALTANATLATPTAVELATITSTPSAIASTGQMVHWDRSGEGDPTIKLLLNGEDLTDSSEGNANVTYTGTDPVSTTQKKYGSSSLKISSDTVITVPASSDYDFGTGDFTISGWFYCQSPGHGDWGGIAAFTPYNGGSTSGYLHNIRCYSTTQELACSTSGGYIRTGHTMATNTWFHLAIVRESDNLKFYIDGSLVHTHALAAGLDFVLGNEGKIQVGQAWHDYVAEAGLSSHAWDGYIDDFCIQSGAKWTGNFTPPSSQTKAGGTSGLYYVAPDGTATLIKGDS